MPDTFDVQITTPPSRSAETLEQRSARIERERALVTQAEADIDAGLGVEWEAVEAWLHALDGDENAPEPMAASVRRL